LPVKGNKGADNKIVKALTPARPYLLKLFSDTTLYRRLNALSALSGKILVDIENFSMVIKPLPGGFP
jgi:hypothetical protein